MTSCKEQLAESTSELVRFEAERKELIAQVTATSVEPLLLMEFEESAS